jgi:peroxiredoxin Q/BCP
MILLALFGCNQVEDGEVVQSAKSASAPLNVKIGDQAPDFTLPGYPHQEFTLSSYLGQQAVVLYFYPKDNTPDCTKEACAFRDTAAEFAFNNAVIVGVSSDDVASHTLFADENDLPFALLSDRNNEVRRTYGNPDGSTSLISRITYVIDRDGIVREIISGNDVNELNDHITRSLSAVAALNEDSNT